jgi:N-acetylneuraminic acid mutarotase
VTVKATSAADTSKSANATITILGAINEWTWASGSNTADQAGIYGTQGTASPSNVPGARYRAASWRDSSGILWLFGGYGYDSGGNLGDLNDLWKYNPTTLEWTWISGNNAVDQAGIYGTKGTAAPSNVPGARHWAVSWLDSSGKLWLFGGGGYDSAGDSGWLNDLWKYDPTALEWTWVSGYDVSQGQPGIYGTKGTAAPSNIPGERIGAVSWLDSSGKLWLFGGGGIDSAGDGGWLNDLWKYDPTALEWTWVSGYDVWQGQPGIYGSKGTAAPSNIPGERIGAVSWLDSSGKLWLFGGGGIDSAGDGGWLNDLWKYDPTTLEWTWISGSNTVDQAGIYGTKGTAAPSNVPGARHSPVPWLDSSGKLWLFGGQGYDSTSSAGNLNDLWKYDPTTLEWTWISGSSTINQAGTYGTQGTAAPSNVPGARDQTVSWLDSSSKLWLFGGKGYDSGSNLGDLNDLWKYDPTTLEWTWISGSNTVSQAGIYGTIGLAASSNVPGARHSPVPWLDSSGKLWLFGGHGYDSAGNVSWLNDLWKYTR